MNGPPLDHHSMVHPELCAQGIPRETELPTGPPTAVQREFAGGPPIVVHKLDQLSTLLGLRVVNVSRDRPLHERALPRVDEPDDDRRMYWHIKVMRPGDERHPLGDGSWAITVHSSQVRNGKRITGLLRAYGSRARLDNRAASTALRLMHEITEGET